GLSFKGYSLAILCMLSAGPSGMLLGKYFPETFVSEARYCWAILLGYAGSFCAGITWGQSYLIQLLEAGTGVLLIYFTFTYIGQELGGNYWRPDWLVNLGRHSLLAYILQIGILQAVVRVIGHPSPLSPRF